MQTYLETLAEDCINAALQHGATSSEATLAYKRWFAIVCDLLAQG